MFFLLILNKELELSWIYQFVDPRAASEEHARAAAHHLEAKTKYQVILAMGRDIDDALEGAPWTV
jgi:hypothetical protein